jgi:hypothetical protein
LQFSFPRIIIIAFLFRYRLFPAHTKRNYFLHHVEMVTDRSRKRADPPSGVTHHPQSKTLLAECELGMDAYIPNSVANKGLTIESPFVLRPRRWMTTLQSGETPQLRTMLSLNQNSTSVPCDYLMSKLLHSRAQRRIGARPSINS